MFDKTSAKSEAILMMKVLCGQTIAMPTRMAQAIATVARRIGNADSRALQRRMRSIAGAQKKILKMNFIDIDIRYKYIQLMDIN